MDSLNIHYLDDQEIKDFELIVANDIKNLASKDDILYLKENLDLWLYFLLVMKRTAEYNLSSRNSTRKVTLSRMRAEKADADDIAAFVASEEKWKVNTTKFLSVLERKILYVKILLKQQNVDE